MLKYKEKPLPSPPDPSFLPLEVEPFKYKKLSYCWETVRRESMPRIAEMDVEMTT